MRRTLRLSVLDAAVYAFMVGLGEVYFLADAIRLGASPLAQGLIVSLPLFVGAAGPLLALRLLPRLTARKPLVLAAAVGQALMLALLAAGDATHTLSPGLLIALVCLYQVCGQAAGTTWASWFGDLVPRTIRGRYFSRRNRAAYLGTFVGLLVGGLFLHYIEPGRAADALADSGRGFVVLFGLASAFRLVSVGLLAASAEPVFHGISGRVRVTRFFASQRGTSAWRLVLMVAALQYAVYIASPYFQPFMLGELKFTYVQYMLASLTVIVMKVAFLPAWGTLIDQYGARQLGSLAALLLALVPLPWLWANGLGWVLVAQAFSGFSWAGFELAEFTLLLETSYRSTRLHVFAALRVGNGLAQLLGGLTGALLLKLSVELQALFAISLVARLLVAVSFLRLLPPARRGAPTIRRHELLLRVIGIRPNGGVVHRPVVEQLPPDVRRRKARPPAG
jgi:MFS family permease